MTRRQKVGNPYPLGCSWQQGFWNFALYSESPLDALVIAPHYHPDNHESFTLTPSGNKTGTIWHIAVEAKEPAIRWGWKIQGNTQLFLDPYAPLLATGSTFGANNWDQFSKNALLSTYSPTTTFDWRDGEQLAINPEELIIYEVHLKAFTQDQSSHVAHPGTYLGFIEKIPYLKDLGINAVEFLPVFEFNEMEWDRTNPRTLQRLCNFWGYSPLSFFSPMMRYGTTDDPFETAKEFKTLIKELHHAGIAAILDVVYNHTGEGNENGPTYCYKALSPEVYYLKDASGSYLNYSGCGNSLNAGHPIVADLILDSLKHWVLEYKIDGFRFDLASEMTRNANGAPSSQPPLFERIIQDPLLKEKYLIVEPWDAAGLHQTGKLFRLNQWGNSSIMEWNDDFRDTTRKFIRGDSGQAGRFAGRLCGSEDVFSSNGSPLNSLNFVTCHDGFTLHDLVSYNSKHNFDNGEHNHDGTDNNVSWNCGHEGVSEDSKIKRLREKQFKNFLIALFIAQGVPMIHSGDEYSHTKSGNNNSWCQNSEISWFLWNEVKSNASWNRFVREMIALRKRNHILRRNRFLQPSDVEWHGKKLFNPDWSVSSQLLNFTLVDDDGKRILHVIFNSSDHAEMVEIPEASAGSTWKLVVQTAQLPPRDIVAPQEASTVNTTTITIQPKSALILETVP